MWFSNLLQVLQNEFRRYTVFVLPVGKGRDKLVMKMLVIFKSS